MPALLRSLGFLLLDRIICLRAEIAAELVVSRSAICRPSNHSVRAERNKEARSAAREWPGRLRCPLTQLGAALRRTRAMVANLRHTACSSIPVAHRVLCGGT